MYGLTPSSVFPNSIFYPFFIHRNSRTSSTQRGRLIIESVGNGYICELCTFFTMSSFFAACKAVSSSPLLKKTRKTAISWRAIPCWLFSTNNSSSHSCAGIFPCSLVQLTSCGCISHFLRYGTYSISDSL